MEIARAMYGSTGDQDALLAAMGAPPEMWETMRAASSVAIWPENLDAFNVFGAMGSQWRTGMGGATGLDYAALPAVMDFCQVKKKHRPEVFESVRVMESAALETMAELRKKD